MPHEEVITEAEKATIDQAVSDWNNEEADATVKAFLELTHAGQQALFRRVGLLPVSGVSEFVESVYQAGRAHGRKAATAELTAAAVAEVRPIDTLDDECPAWPIKHLLFDADAIGSSEWRLVHDFVVDMIANQCTIGEIRSCLGEIQDCAEYTIQSIEHPERALVDKVSQQLSYGDTLMELEGEHPDLAALLKALVESVPPIK